MNDTKRGELFAFFDFSTFRTFRDSALVGFFFFSFSVSFFFFLFFVLLLFSHKKLPIRLRDCHHGIRPQHLYMHLYYIDVCVLCRMRLFACIGRCLRATLSWNFPWVLAQKQGPSAKRSMAEHRLSGRSSASLGLALHLFKLCSPLR